MIPINKMEKTINVTEYETPTRITKVKIFNESSVEELEGKINEFFEEKGDILINDIKYNSIITSGNEDYKPYKQETCLILYTEYLN